MTFMNLSDHSVASLAGMRLQSELEEKSASCPKHGAYQAYRLIGTGGWSSCPRCREEALFAEAMMRREQASIMETQARMNDLMKSSGLPARLRDARLDGFICSTEKAQKTARIAKRYIENFDTVKKNGVWLAFVGLAGTGKTYLAAAIATELIFQQRTVLMMRAFDLADRVKAERFRGNNPYSIATQSELLIVDEMSASDFSAELYHALDARYQAMLPTILIANAAIDGEKDPLTVFDHRIADRIRDNGGFALYFDWESRRSGHKKGTGWLLKE